jgi:hypothetical protein
MQLRFCFRKPAAAQAGVQRCACHVNHNLLFSKAAIP